MKINLFFLFFLLAITSSFACVCDDSKTITDEFLGADFIAKIKIIKNHKNEEEHIYKADILIEELYKGNAISSIYVYGRHPESPRLLESFCGIFIKEGTEFIVYGRKDKKGRIIIGLCSRSLFLSDEYSNYEKREMEILKTLKKNNIKYTNRIRVFSEDIKLELKKYSEITLQKEFALYEINFSSDIKVKDVREISGFGNKIDNELLELIKRSKWELKRKTVDISKGFKFLFGIYYHSSKRGSKCFLSQYD